MWRGRERGGESVCGREGGKEKREEEEGGEGGRGRVCFTAVFYVRMCVWEVGREGVCV